MSTTEEIIFERTGAMTGRKIRDPFTHDTSAFMPDDYIAELPPQDVLARWAVEAKEMCENHKALNARLGEQIRFQLEQMVSDSLNRRKSETK